MSALDVLGRVADTIDEYAQANPSRWGDLKFLAAAIHQEIQHELEGEA